MMLTPETREEVVGRVCAAVTKRPSAAWTSARLATMAGASPVQLQRAFRAVLGMSPRDFITASKRRRFLDTLRTPVTVTDAIYESGYGSSSRAYDAIRLPGMTPATYGRGGKGARIQWAVASSPIGRIMVAATARGLCFVQVGQSDRELVTLLKREFPLADVSQSASASLDMLTDAARAVAEARPLPAMLPVDIRGTAFQWRVWRALTRIPRGSTRSYSEVARTIGTPAAIRAVARACATNPLSLVVPCHRVVGRDGSLKGYRWGTEVKKALLEKEAETVKKRQAGR